MNNRSKIYFLRWQDVHRRILARPRQAERGQRGRRQQQQQRRINRFFGRQWSGSSTIQSGFSTVDKLSRRRFPIFIWQFDNKKSVVRRNEACKVLTKIITRDVIRMFILFFLFYLLICRPKISEIKVFHRFETFQGSIFVCKVFELSSNGKINY